MTTEFLEGVERCARESLQEKHPPSDKEAARRSSASTINSAKRMKIGSTSDPGLSEKANNLASEELNLRLRRTVLANLGKSSQNENAKIKQISAERQHIKSQLLQQAGVPPLLPQASPLKNIVNFARIEEEIVQAKIQYALAEKQLRLERQTLGRASDAIIQRVKAIGKALAELYERRDATQVDRTRIEEFRRPASPAKTEPLTTRKAFAPMVNFVLSDPIPDSEEGEIRDGHPPWAAVFKPMTKPAKDQMAPS
jgi:hypothetical protein